MKPIQLLVALTLLLTSLARAADSLTITNSPACPGRISQSQYGQFIEYLNTLVPSMFAERLYDASFEGLSPYRVAFIAETDFKEKPWYPSGQTNRAEFSHDPVNPLAGQFCQKIAVAGGQPATVGLSQDGLFVDKDEPLKFSIHLRQQGITGPITIRIHKDGTDYASAEFTATADWKKYAANLTAAARNTNATLTLSFKGPGTLWLDNASLMPVANVAGWRPDVAKAIMNLRPGVIRFGGSALDDPGLGDFEWRDTIGPVDARKPFRAWGGLQPHAAGLAEIVELTQFAGAQPLICVRVRNRPPKDAADQVEYFNGAVDTPMGKLRASHGRREPYNIKYWQIGNEQGGRAYEDLLPKFAEAMKKVDPTIKILASYPSEGVLKQAGAFIDFVCPHHYDCANIAAAEQDIVNVSALCKRIVPDRDIRIAVTEWNTTAGDWGPKRATLWTLQNALLCARYHNMLHRHCDVVEMACRSNLSNSFCSGIIQTDNHRIYFTPTYYAQELYATRAGSRPLKIEGLAPADNSADYSATLSEKGDMLTLFAVNLRSEKHPISLDLSAWNIQPDATVHTLADTQSAGEADAANSFDDPRRIISRSSPLKLDARKLEHALAPLSLTVFQIPVKP